MAEEVKLLKTWSSPFGLRIVWALKLKGIHFDPIDEDLSNKSPLLLQYNPVYKKIPVLVHNRKPISESLVILEYVDETWKQNPLMPQDPYEKAMARFWAKFGDDKVSLSIWNVFIKQGKDQEALQEAMENLKFLEENLKGKKFFGGEKIGYLDIALGWLANLISLLEEIIDIKIIDKERFPLLFGWIQEFSQAPIIKESWPPHDKMLTRFQIMLENQLKLAAAQTN
ncbi:probable glutathione S-transferase [Mangifera indica]|uniref:probable glutathione S-transferase n=1 Tax=Mangifera indica TaxID=29780 RepID=UPI001CFA3D54|nr:probable glutathione S-transferase [Mangifera indica]